MYITIPKTYMLNLILHVYFEKKTSPTQQT